MNTSSSVIWVLPAPSSPSPQLPAWAALPFFMLVLGATIGLFVFAAKMKQCGRQLDGAGGAYEAPPPPEVRHATPPRTGRELVVRV